jgi:DNA-binding beta-propeller fold protein YncE
VKVGLGPRGVVVNPRTGKIYVGNTAVSQGSVQPAPDGLPDTISVIRDRVRRKHGHGGG